jgi:hypothetical protein
MNDCELVANPMPAKLLDGLKKSKNTRKTWLLIQQIRFLNVSRLPPSRQANRLMFIISKPTFTEQQNYVLTKSACVNGLRLPFWDDPLVEQDLTRAYQCVSRRRQ